MQKCNHDWVHPFSVSLGQFVPYAYKCRLCGDLIISDNGAILELEQKMKSPMKAKQFLKQWLVS